MEPIDRPDVRGHVTPDVAAYLDGSGRFREIDRSGFVPAEMISQEEAALFAEAFLFTWGPVLHPLWEERRGAPISLAGLRAAELYFARSPYGDVPDDLDPLVRRWLGPQFHTVFADRNGPVVAFGLAAYNDSLWVDEDGFLRNSGIHGIYTGGEWSAWAIPAALEPRWVTPEAAVRFVSERTGALIAALPALQRAPARRVPFRARWHLVLDRPVTAVLESGARRATREVYVGVVNHELSVATEDQPDGYTDVFPLYPVPGEETEFEVRTIPRRAGLPIEFEPVVDLHAADSR